jgi:hypothetical protein
MDVCMHVLLCGKYLELKTGVFDDKLALAWRRAQESQPKPKWLSLSKMKGRKEGRKE